MSKKSRGFQPEKQSSGSGAADGRSGAADGSTEASSSRSAQRKRARTRRTTTTRSKSTAPAWQRYRGALIAGIAVVGVGIVGIALFGGASAAPYECASLLTPAPDSEGPAPAAGPVASAAPTPLTGFVTEDLGRGHVASGSSIEYAFCPPTSGEHWSIAGRAPLRRDVYGPNDSVSPGNWVHNLEHGYVIIAYQGEPEADVMDGIREVFEQAEQKEIAAQCGIPNKVIAVPFQDMSEPYAVLAWDRAMLMPEWDTQRALTFANQWQESPQNPEPAC